MKKWLLMGFLVSTSSVVVADVTSSITDNMGTILNEIKSIVSQAHIDTHTDLKTMAENVAQVVISEFKQLFNKIAGVDMSSVNGNTPLTDAQIQNIQSNAQGYLNRAIKELTATKTLLQTISDDPNTVFQLLTQIAIPQALTMLSNKFSLSSSTTHTVTNTLVPFVNNNQDGALKVIRAMIPVVNTLLAQAQSYSKALNQLTNMNDKRKIAEAIRNSLNLKTLENYLSDIEPQIINFLIEQGNGTSTVLLAAQNMELPAGTGSGTGV